MNETGRSVATPPPGIPSLAVRAPAAHLGVAVVRELTDVIVTGVLKPGGLLPPEASLTAQFGVSRTVIRESIKRIEEKGLVTVTQGFGTRVSEPTEWNLLDPVVLRAMIDHDDALGILDEVSRVRASLEATMAGDAAEKATESQVADLRDALDDMLKSLDDPDEFTIADRRFHNLVMRYSGNRLAPSMARTLFNRALESRRYHGVDPDNALELTTEAHQRIFNAIQSRDREAASRAMFDHIEGSWQARRLPSGEAAS